jgi:hypothetical protein
MVCEALHFDTVDYRIVPTTYQYEFISLAVSLVVSLAVSLVVSLAVSLVVSRLTVCEVERSGKSDPLPEVIYFPANYVI